MSDGGGAGGGGGNGGDGTGTLMNKLKALSPTATHEHELLDMREGDYNVPAIVLTSISRQNQ